MNKKHNVFFLSFIVIFSLVLLSSQMVIGINARFVSSDQANDEGRVAKLDVEIDVTDLSDITLTSPLKIMPGETETIIVDVKSNSEIMLEGEITVSTLGNLPLTILIDNNKFKFDENTNSFKATVAVIWDEKDNDVKYCGEIDVLQVNVSIVQTA